MLYGFAVKKDDGATSFYLVSEDNVEAAKEYLFNTLYGESDFFSLSGEDIVHVDNEDLIRDNFDGISKLAVID